MDLFPATTVADLTTSLGTAITENGAILIGVTGLAIGVKFVMRWFTRGVNKV